MRGFADGVGEFVDGLHPAHTAAAATGDRLDEDGELHVIGRQQAIRRIQREAARLKKPGESIVDEFIAEKRAEAARE